jgi:dienelactone hydrolase
VTGLTPHSAVTLTATTIDAAGKAWRSEARYAANGHGVVDPGKGRSVDGTYTGSAAMGLFWSMLPVGWKGSTKPAGMAPPTIGEVLIAVHGEGHVLARTRIVRRVANPEVSIRDETIVEEGFIGRFCSEPSLVPRAAILRLGGSEGGLAGDTTCAILASHGYPTLNLAYFGLPGLPTDLSRIPLEYFEHALEWLSHQPGVDPQKVVAMGSSRGGEAALLIASIYTERVHGAIGLVPSSVVNPARGGPDPAWTYRGEPLPFLQIPVEQINGPVFVVGAGQDYVWPSSIYVGNIDVRMRERGRRDVTALVYLQAGHGIGSLLPNVRTPTALQTRYGYLEFGGSPAADAHARAAAWPKLLAFLGKL